MAEYIQKEAALSTLTSEGVTKNMRAHRRVANLPAADVVEVVSCADCRFQDTCNRTIELIPREAQAGYLRAIVHHCEYGERRGRETRRPAGTENKEETIVENIINKETYYIVRCDRAGVFAGNIKSREGREVVLTNVRRLWYWDGAASLSQMAVNGVTKPQNCKFTVTVPEIIVLDAIEILACSDKAEASIRGVKEWKM